MQRLLPALCIASVSALLCGCGSNEASRIPVSPASPSSSVVARISRADASIPEATCNPKERQPDSLALRALADVPLTWRKPEVESRSLERVTVLGFSDFHGQLLPPPPLEGRPLGGATALSAYVREEARRRPGATLVVHAGDLIGASPPESALNQDEPTIEFLSRILGAPCPREARGAPSCHVVAGLGNHEFDEGVAEFRRIFDGGQHARGPFLGQPHEGAGFEIVGANVIERRTGMPIVAPFVVRELGRVKVGVIGAVVRGAPVFLQPSRIAEVSFEDEARAIDAAAETLVKDGVRTIVVLLHQGGTQCFGPRVARREPFVHGAVVDIVRRLHPEVDVVISGHTHSLVQALVANRGGVPTLVTHALFSGTALAKIDLAVDHLTGDVVEKQASILSTWRDQPPGNQEDADIAELVSRAHGTVKERTERLVGEAGAAFSTTLDPAGNSEMGALLTDAQRELAGVDIALLTPSWIRGSLAAGRLSWGELFRVQPFGDRLVKTSLTGKQLLALLNQQWVPDDHQRILQVSGISYSWDPWKAPDRRVNQIWVAEKPLVLEQRYTVVMNEYLAEGGDAFTVLESAVREPTPWLDIDALENYVKLHSPITPDRTVRITRIGESQ